MKQDFKQCLESKMIIPFARGQSEQKTDHNMPKESLRVRLFML
jgi:hypothetical protein